MRSCLHQAHRRRGQDVVSGGEGISQRALRAPHQTEEVQQPSCIHTDRSAVTPPCGMGDSLEVRCFRPQFILALPPQSPRAPEPQSSRVRAFPAQLSSCLGRLVSGGPSQKVLQQSMARCCEHARALFQPTVCFILTGIMRATWATHIVRSPAYTGV